MNQSIIICLIVVIGLLGCGSPNFQDVEKGKIHLDPQDAAAIKKLLADAGIESKKLPVFQDLSRFQGTLCNEKILIENKRVTGLLLGWGKLKDMEPTAALTELRILRLPCNQIQDIQGLEEAVKLEHLDLSCNKLTSFRGLEGCTALKHLFLNKNELNTFPDISNFPALESLDLSFNRIETMEGFHRGQKLRWLAIAYNKLSSPVGIRNLANLIYLNLGNNGLTTLKGLEGLPQLTTLILKENKLARVEELFLFPELRTVELQANNITELPNPDNPKIKIRIENNPVAEAWEKTRASAPPPGHIPDSSPPRTLTLPSGGGSLSSWGTARKKYVNPFKGKKRFSVYRNGISLRGVHRLDVLPSAFNGCLTRVKISLSRGKVRVYLKAPDTYRYVEDRFGNKQLERVPVPGYVYATATPEQSCILLGLLMSFSYGSGQIVLESVDGSASGISYEVTDTYSD